MKANVLTTRRIVNLFIALALVVAVGFFWAEERPVLTVATNFPGERASHTPSTRGGTKVRTPATTNTATTSECLAEWKSSRRPEG